MKNYFHEKGSSAVDSDAVRFLLTYQIVRLSSILLTFLKNTFKKKNYVWNNERVICTGSVIFCLVF